MKFEELFKKAADISSSLIMLLKSNCVGLAALDAPSAPINPPSVL